MSTLGTILKDNFTWRKQIAQLARFDLKKRSRGAALGSLWLFVKPALYILVFWFALEIGLKQEHISGYDLPYIIWLMAGLIPWFFMQDQLGMGSRSLNRYNYLVNKVKFPLSSISTIVTSTNFIIHIGLVIAMFVVYFLVGGTADLYLLQVPLVMVLMYIFWWAFAQMSSLLSAMSKDFNQFLHAFSQPLFWLSGIIFSVETLAARVPALHTLFYFNPISFFAESMRSAFYYKTWMWDDPMFIGCFVFMLVVQFALMCFVYKRTRKEVCDVL